MKKIIISLLVILFAVPFAGNAASVTIDTIPTVCSSAVFRGSASYSAPDTLTVKLNGSAIFSSGSGNSPWQVTSTGPFIGSNTLTAQVSSTTAGVIASASQTFGANCGGQDPMAVTQVWGLTGHQTPRTKVGEVVIDRYGFRSICDLWMPKYLGCFNISNTAYYLSGIRAAFGLK